MRRWGGSWPAKGSHPVEGGWIGGVAEAQIQSELRPAANFDGAAEAKLIALTCSPSPEGFARWSLRLLEDDGQFVRSVALRPITFDLISDVERNPHSLAFQFERVVSKLAEIRCPVASGCADPMSPVGGAFEPFVPGRDPACCAGWGRSRRGGPCSRGRA